MKKVHFKEGPIKGLFITTPHVFSDNRGDFFECYNEQTYVAQGELSDFSIGGAFPIFYQDNISISAKNVVRGLHYQWESPMGKFIQAIKGRLMDVVVDIRSNSETYGKHFTIELSEENRLQLFIPPGFAHGFVSLEDDTIAHYKCTACYNAEGESGINPFDDFLNIDWGINKEDAIVSDKDTQSQSFKSYQEDPKFKMPVMSEEPPEGLPPEEPPEGPLEALALEGLLPEGIHGERV